MKNRLFSKRNSFSSRKLQIQHLEQRDLLAANPFGQNPLQRLDVSRDGRVSAADALQIINALNQSTDPSGANPADSVGQFIDVNGDGKGSASDALEIVFALNRAEPTLSARLVNDSRPISSLEHGFDLRTNDYAIDLDVSLGELGDKPIRIKIGDQPAQEITDRFTDNRTRLTKENIDTLFGGPLPDGDHRVIVELGDDPGNELDFLLTVDRTIPPSITQVSPQRSVLTGARSVSIEFEDPISDLFVDLEGVSLVDQNDAAKSLLPESFVVAADKLSIELQFASEIPEGSYELVVDESRLANTTGSAVGTQTRRSNLDVLRPTAIWNNPEGGSWDVASNWESGSVPTANDVVLLAIPGKKAIFLPPAPTSVKHLSIVGDVIFRTGNEFTAETISIDGGTVEMDSNMVFKDTIINSPRNNGEIVLTSQLTLSGVTLNVPLTINANQSLIVENGMQLNGRITIAGSDSSAASLILQGDQQITGRGTIEFGSATELSSRNRIQVTRDSLVVFDSTLKLRGRHGQINDFSAANFGKLDLQAKVIAEADGDIRLYNIGSNDNILNLNLTGQTGTIGLGNLEDVIINNVGDIPLEMIGSQFTRVTLNTPLLLTEDTLQIRDYLTLNSTITLAGSDDIGSGLSLPLGADIKGTGEIIFEGTTSSRMGNTIVGGGNTAQNPESIGIIESGITIRGGMGQINGAINFQDRFMLNGKIIAGENSNIGLNSVSSIDGLNIDARAGKVEITNISDMKINGPIGSRIFATTGGVTWRNVSLDVDVVVPADTRMTIRDGITFNGTFTLEGADRDSNGDRRTRVEFDGDQTISGTGDFIFAGEATTSTQNVLAVSPTSIVTFSPDIDVRGHYGRLLGSHIRFGDVLDLTDQAEVHFQGTIQVIDGGLIEASHLFGDGGTVTFDSRKGQINVYALTDVVAEGVGETEIQVNVEPSSAFWDNVTLNTNARLESQFFQVRNGLEVNGRLFIAYDQGVDIQFRETPDQTVNGSGELIFLSTTEGNPHRIQRIGTNDFQVQLTFGPLLKISGDDLFFQGSPATPIVVQSSLVTDAGGEFVLNGVVTSPGVLAIQPQAGKIYIQQVPPSTLVTGPVDAVAYVLNGHSFDDVTINIPVLVESPINPSSGKPFRVVLSFNNGLTLNSTLTLLNESSEIFFGGDQTLSGNGEIVLKVFDPDPNDDIAVSGHRISTDGLLRIESGITIRGGKGTIGVTGRDGKIDLQGTIIDGNNQLTVSGLL